MNKEKNYRLQFLAHQLLGNKEGEELIDLLFGYFTRQPLLPNGKALGEFGNNVTAYLAYHEGSRKTLHHLRDIINAYENNIEAENKG